jgi:hypothetical protein
MSVHWVKADIAIGAPRSDFDPRVRPLRRGGWGWSNLGAIFPADRRVWFIGKKFAFFQKKNPTSSGEGVSYPAFSFQGSDSVPVMLLAKQRPKFPTALREPLAKPLLKQDR